MFSYDREQHLEEDQSYKEEDGQYADGRILRVYYVPEDDTYFINVWAAFTLGLIDYNEANNLYDSGTKLFNISKVLLRMYENIFRIELFIIHKQRKRERVKERELIYDNDKNDSKFSGIVNDIDCIKADSYKFVTDDGICRYICIRNFNNFDINKYKFVPENNDYSKLNENGTFVTNKKKK